MPCLLAATVFGADFFCFLNRLFWAISCKFAFRIVCFCGVAFAAGQVDTVNQLLFDCQRRQRQTGSTLPAGIVSALLEEQAANLSSLCLLSKGLVTMSALKQSGSLGGRLKAFINSPTGPRTTHFWGPVRIVVVSLRKSKLNCVQDQTVSNCVLLCRLQTGVLSLR